MHMFIEIFELFNVDIDYLNLIEFCSYTNGKWKELGKRHFLCEFLYESISWMISSFNERKIVGWTIVDASFAWVQLRA